MNTILNAIHLSNRSQPDRSPLIVILVYAPYHILIASEKNRILFKKALLQRSIGLPLNRLTSSAARC